MKKHHTSLVFLAVCVALMYVACSKTEVSPNSATVEPVANTAEEKAILGLRNASNTAIANRDSVKAGIDAAPDYTVISARSFEGKGPAVLKTLWYSEFTNKKEAFYERIPDKITVYENWNMGAEYGHWRGSWIEADGKLEIEGTYFAKWHKLNGAWKMRSEVFVPASCKGSVACDKRPF